MVQFAFNALQYAPSTGGSDIFETGEYTMHITESKVVETKNKTGSMLVLTLSCLDEGMAGRRLEERLNLVNQSAQAQEIAYRNLSAISYVCGVLQWNDSQQLHGRPFRVRVTKDARSDDPTKFENNIRAYMDTNGQPPGAQANTGGPAAPAAPAPRPAAPAAAPAPAPAFTQPAPAAAPAPAFTQPAPAAAPAPAFTQPAPAAPFGQAPTSAAPWAR